MWYVLGTGLPHRKPPELIRPLPLFLMSFSQLSCLFLLSAALDFALGFLSHLLQAYHSTVWPLRLLRPRILIPHSCLLFLPGALSSVSQALAGESKGGSGLAGSKAMLKERKMSVVKS